MESLAAPSTTGKEGRCKKAYPWMSTKPGRCKNFKFVQEQGFRRYCEEKCVRGTTSRIASCTSPELMALLEGMTIFNPSKRLTLGGKQWPRSKKSVWDEPW